MLFEKYLAELIAPLLAHPEDARICLSTDEMGLLLTVVVHPEDMGPLIGRSGETAKAIRHLIRIAGVKHTARVSVKINEPDGSPSRPKRSDDRELVAQ